MVKIMAIKKFLVSDEYDIDTDTYYIGKTSDIKAMYKSIVRNRTSNLSRMFLTTPKFSDSKDMYALCINNENYVTIVNSDTMLSILMDNNLHIVEA